MIRVMLPHHLQTLARTEAEVMLKVTAPVTLASVLDELEWQYPMLRGTVRDQVTGRRRARVRFFACEQDISLEKPEKELPGQIRQGEEPLMIVGAISGG